MDRYVYRVLYQIEKAQRNGTRAILNFFCGMWTLEKDVTCDITRHEGAASSEQGFFNLQTEISCRRKTNPPARKILRGSILAQG
mmetsp:Transcript_26025/g.30226  ORF Transcript_26025/g.30226 Transcript_26025/m.30226 type:complete len:84 (+) Transcript_26025:259-510(+)